MPTPVHIDFRRSGGIAGIDMTASVDSRDLPDEHAGVAADLLTGGDNLRQDDSPGVPDGFTYEVNVSDGSRSQQYQWSGPQVPAAVRPLLDDLGKRAQPASPA